MTKSSPHGIPPQITIHSMNTRGKVFGEVKALKELDNEISKLKAEWNSSPEN